MPSFKFLGFASGSTVALTVAQGALSAQAALTWGQAGGGGQPNATFSIARVDNKINAHLIAPCGVFFKAANLTGFSVTEPQGDTNVYDPTQHRINFIWDFGDPGYVPRTTPNIPTVWRNTNIAYGKSVAHVFNASGNYSVTCWAFDDAGNWGTATYTFQSGGNAGPILSQADAFPTTATVCYSPAGNFTGAPAGAWQETTIAGVNSRLNASTPLMRLLLRRDEVYSWGRTTASMKREERTGFYIGHYGSGTNAPRINSKKAEGGAIVEFVAIFNGPCGIDGIDFYGDWDSTTETGLASSLLGPLGMYSEDIVFHRCTFSGFSDLRVRAGGNAITDARAVRIFNDCRVTNWKDYGALSGAYAWGVIGCDWSQHVDALTGVNQGTASQSPTNFGNTHGPLRTGGKFFYLGASSFFTRNGWSQSSNFSYSGVGGIPTEPQGTVRESTAGPVTDRQNHIHERCSHEGMDITVLSATFTTTLDCPRNRVFDKCLFVTSAYCGDEILKSEHPGLTIRNSYFYRPNVAKQRGGNVLGTGVINHDFVGSGPANTPTRIYNNTAWIPGPTANIGTAAPIFIKTNGAALTSENNIFFAPDLTSPIGASFAPLGTSPIAGFQCQFKGGRWNFPPIGGTGFQSAIPVTSVREGGAGTVANLEWVSLPYPNYTGLSGGALGQVTQAVVTGNSTQKHQVSVTEVSPKRMGDQTLWSDCEDRVRFDFTPTAIRIQNRTGAPWSSGDIWVQLDLSDYLMTFEAGSANPLGVPNAVPGTASAARVAGGAGLWAFDDFFGTIRQGQTVMGAVQPAA